MEEGGCGGRRLEAREGGNVSESSEGRGLTQSTRRTRCLENRCRVGAGSRGIDHEANSCILWVLEAMNARRVPEDLDELLEDLLTKLVTQELRDRGS